MNNKIEQYINSFPPEVKDILIAIRKVIINSAPDAEEVMKYNMPTYVMGKNLVSFGGFKNHVGLYPTPEAIDAFKDELQGYKSEKGSVQFPYDKPIPYDLIASIVKYRVNGNNRE